MVSVGCSSRQHPYLAFSEQDVPRLVARSKKFPYDRWIEIVRANAACGLKFKPGTNDNKQCPEQSPVPPGMSCSWTSAATNESCQSGYAFNLALANTLEPNPAYVAKVIELLRQAGKYEQGWQNTTGGAWYWGSDLLNYAYAYDMIQPYLPESQDKFIKNVLEGMVSGTMPAYLDHKNYAYVTNIRLRVGSGLGTLALALDGAGLSSERAEEVERNLFGYMVRGVGIPNRYVSTTVTPEGTMNEGPSYQNDAFTNMLPYLYVLKRVKGRDYINGDNTIDGWQGDNRIAKMFQRNAALSMPDKNTATVTTGWRFGFNFGNVAAPGLIEPHNEAMRWFFLWQEGSGPFIQSTPGFAFLYVNTQITPKPPEYLSLVTPDWSSFRTGWDTNSTYFLMQSEYWPEYSTHGQPDQTSFILYAKDRYLLIDPGDGRNYCAAGYSGCTQYKQINHSPEAHNLVIVDAQRGCNSSFQTPARLSGSYTRTRDPVTLLAGFVPAELNSSMLTLQNYFGAPDVSTYRTSMMARNNYLVVFDGMVSSKSKSHKYDALLHFGGPLSNTSAICQAAQSGTNEQCTAGDADKNCWEAPPVQEDQGAPPTEDGADPDESGAGAPSSCKGSGMSPVPDGVTNCGSVEGTLTYTSGADRLTWQTKSNRGEDIELLAAYAPTPMSITQDTFPTNFYINAIFTHPFVRAHYEGATTQWLNVLYPRKVGNTEPVPVITQKAVQNGNGSALQIKIEPSRIDDVAIASDGAAVITVEDGLTFQGRATMVLRTGGTLVRTNVHEAQSLTVGGTLVFSSNAPIHATFAPSGDIIAGEIVAAQPTQVCFANRTNSARIKLNQQIVNLTPSASSQVCLQVPKGRHVIAAPNVDP